MPFETYSSGLTIQAPMAGTKNWAETLKTQLFEKISAHDHTGAGKGLQIATAALASNAVTTAKITDGNVTTAKLADNAVTTLKIADANVTAVKLAGGLVLPTAAITPYGGESAPSGWLLCDGTAVSRATYSDLFAVVSTKYGVGDGATTFNLPDFRQRFPLGKAASGTGSTLGGTGGNIDHVHSGPNHTHDMASHTHDMANHTHNGPSHTHDAGNIRAQIGMSLAEGLWRSRLDGTNTFTSDYKHDASSPTVDSAAGIASVLCTGPSASAGNGSTSGPSINTSDTPSTNTTGASGTGDTGLANPPFQVVNYIIKT